MIQLTPQKQIYLDKIERFLNDEYWVRMRNSEYQIKLICFDSVTQKSMRIIEDEGIDWIRFLFQLVQEGLETKNIPHLLNTPPPSEKEMTKNPLD